MNVYEKIKNMSIDEMSKFLNGIPNECFFCECGIAECGSIAGTKALLEKEWVDGKFGVMRNE